MTFDGGFISILKKKFNIYLSLPIPYRPALNRRRRCTLLDTPKMASSLPRSYIQVSRLVDFLSGGGVFSYDSHHLLRRTTTTRCSDREVKAAHAHS